jgi:hypothetical protein
MQWVIAPRSVTPCHAALRHATQRYAMPKEKPRGTLLGRPWGVKAAEGLGTQAPLLFICHGLGGTAENGLIVRLTELAAAKGWRSVVYIRRGHAGTSLLPAVSSCSATGPEDILLCEKYQTPSTFKVFPAHCDVDDMSAVVQHIKKQYAGAVMVAVGVSAGANLLVKDDAPTRKYCALYSDIIREEMPSVSACYRDSALIDHVSRVVGCKVHAVPNDRTVDQSVQIYTDKGDGASWHHDRSVFNGGRVFTVLIVPFNTSDQRLRVWTKKHGVEELQWHNGMLVVIEKFRTFHSVTPLQNGQPITFTYAELHRRCCGRSNMH